MEALGYVRRFAEPLRDEPGLKVKILREVDQLTALLLKGAVKDFRHRIEG